MKVGDMVQYNSNDPFDIQSMECTLGIVTDIVGNTEPTNNWAWAEVIWSLPSGPHKDQVPLSSLTVIGSKLNESR